MSFENSNLRTKLSKSNHWIPLVNNIYLHSQYNPVKEANEFVIKYNQRLKENHNILILGSGFRYHIEAIAKLLERYHQNRFKIIAIEPNKNVFEQSVKIDSFSNQNCEILYNLTIDELYQMPHFVKFLIDRPLIIPHPPSFNLYKEYFKNLLTFKAKDQIKHYLHQIKDPDLLTFLNKMDKKTNFNHVCDKITKSDLQENRISHIFLALNSIREQGSQKEVQ